MRISRRLDQGEQAVNVTGGWTARNASVPAVRSFRLLAPAIFLCLSLALIPGCFPTANTNDQGAHQSLVEIGERALETAEEMENRDENAEANLYYRRALWAFRYHEQLTGEEPLLLEEALEGKKRTDK